MKYGSNNILLSNRRYCRSKGIALLVTLAVLVILTTIVYSLTVRLSIYKRRREYMINYQAARYACDSAMKYALLTAKDLKPELAARQDVPDFSDLFYLTGDQEREMLQEWAEFQAQEKLLKMEEEGADFDSKQQHGPMAALAGILSGDLAGNDPNMENDPNIPSDSGSFSNSSGIIDPNNQQIPGPYGAQWPYVQKPVEFEIGRTKITINIRDENAKLPLVWALMKDEKLTRATDDILDIFCQWMQMDFDGIDKLRLELEDIKERKTYSQTLKPIVTIEKTTKQVPVRSSRRSSRSRTSSARSRRTATRRTTTRTVSTKKTRPVSAHYSDYSRLMRSSLIDTDILARNLSDTGDRKESPLKYMALHGTQKVNINTAPRHVLIAAFTFGGDADDIAQAIIQQRKEKPFKDLADFKERNYGFSDSIRKVEPYITTVSRFFAIEVTASCGNAVATSVTTFIKEGKKIEKIAMMSN